MADDGVEITFEGSLFDGSLMDLLEEARQDAGRAVAEEAADQIRNRLDIVLQEPTGYYRSRIEPHPRGDDWVVSDWGVVYSSWLEGTSSRNASTRFKGYETFKKVRRSIDQVADQIAEDTYARFLR